MRASGQELDALLGASLRIRSTGHRAWRFALSNDCPRTRIGPLRPQQLHVLIDWEAAIPQTALPEKAVIDGTGASGARVIDQAHRRFPMDGARWWIEHVGLQSVKLLVVQRPKPRAGAVVAESTTP